MKNRFELIDQTLVIFIYVKGKFLEVYTDKDFLDKLNNFPNTWGGKWSPSTKKYYVQAKLNKKRVELHRFLTDAAEGYEVDHLDGNPLNNRLENLRVTTKSQNQLNRQSATKTSKTGIRGVSWDLKAKKWRAQIQVNKIKYNLGFFNEIEDAKKAVDCALNNYLLRGV